MDELAKKCIDGIHDLAVFGIFPHCAKFTAFSDDIAGKVDCFALAIRIDQHGRQAVYRSMGNGRRKLDAAFIDVDVFFHAFQIARNPLENDIFLYNCALFFESENRQQVIAGTRRSVLIINARDNVGNKYAAIANKGFQFLDFLSESDSDVGSTMIL